MEQKISLRILSFFVIAYMLLALMWWSVLLHKKNTEVYQYKKEVLELKGDTKESFDALELKYKRQSTMILGESMVFGLMLVIGIFFIYRAYKRGMDANRQQNNFLLSITHELKSPLAASKLAFETLKRENISLNQKNDLIKTGIKENDRLSSLVDNLLLAAKLDQNYAYHFKPVLINDIAQRAVQYAKVKNPNSNFELILNAAKNQVFGDEAAIEIILNNLIDNAIKYSGEDVNIIIETKNISEELEISVADTGSGIPENERQKVFEKFYRIGNEETRTNKGTGLGLYICKSIIEDHKGSIKIENHSPKGSKIFLRFPIHKTQINV